MAHEKFDPLRFYDLQEKVGIGSFGTVYKAVTVEGDTVAIKVIDLDGPDEELEDVRRELELLSTANACEQLVCYLGAHIVEGQLWIATEYLEGGSLGELMEASGSALREETIAGVMVEMCRGLEYLHGERRVHRDVKSKNVLVSRRGSIKLADFGVAARLTDTTTKRKSFMGTPYWMAPEVIEQSLYNTKADVWSLGITAIELAKRKPPHSTLHPMKVLFVVPRAPPPTLGDDKFSVAFQRFVARCLQKLANDRPSAPDLLKTDAFLLEANVSDAKRDLANLVAKHSHKRPPHDNKSPLTKKKINITRTQDTLQVPASIDEEEDRAGLDQDQEKRFSGFSSTTSESEDGLLDHQLHHHHHHRKKDNRFQTTDALRPRSEPAGKKTANSRAFRVLFAPAIATAARYAIAKGGAS